MRNTILPVGLTKLLVETKLCGLLPVGLTKLLIKTKLCNLESSSQIAKEKREIVK